MDVLGWSGHPEQTSAVRRLLPLSPFNAQGRGTWEQCGPPQLWSSRANPLLDTQRETERQRTPTTPKNLRTDPAKCWLFSHHHTCKDRTCTEIQTRDNRTNRKRESKKRRISRGNQRSQAVSFSSFSSCLSVSSSSCLVPLLSLCLLLLLSKAQERQARVQTTLTDSSSRVLARYLR